MIIDNAKGLEQLGSPEKCLAFADLYNVIQDLREQEEHLQHLNRVALEECKMRVEQMMEKIGKK